MKTQLTDKQRLEMKVADMILAVCDDVDELDRSDLQGVADVKAREIIKLINESEA